MCKIYPRKPSGLKPAEIKDLLQTIWGTNEPRIEQAVALVDYAREVIDNLSSKALRGVYPFLLSKEAKEFLRQSIQELPSKGRATITVETAREIYFDSLLAE